MIQIIDVKPSTRDSKRYQATLNIDGKDKVIHFGQKGGSTFIDHKDVQKRDNYRARHLASKREGQYIRDLSPSPATLSFWLLWGDSDSLVSNIRALQKKWKG
jgi:hypothetical protein